MKEIPVTFKSHGKQIVGMLHLPNQKNAPVIIMCHGYSADKSSGRVFVEVARKLMKNGFSVLRFDPIGSGDSEGDFKNQTLTTQLEDLRITIKYLKSRNDINNGKIGLIGWSWGGALAIIYASKYQAVSCLDLWAPGTFKETWGNAFINEIKSRKSWDVYGTTMFKKQILDDLKYDVFKLIKKIKVPIQITNGTEDVNVPFANAKKLYSTANKPKRLVKIKGADHYFRLEKQKNKLTNSSIVWFKKWLK